MRLNWEKVVADGRVAEFVWTGVGITAVLVILAGWACWQIRRDRGS